MEKKLTAFNGYSFHMDTIKDIVYLKKKKKKILYSNGYNKRHSLSKKGYQIKTNLLLLSTTKKYLSKRTNLLLN